MVINRVCSDCVHLIGWTEYGCNFVDCAHPKGSEIFGSFDDMTEAVANSAIKCPYYEEVRYDAVETS
jgi:hypothetical protein